MGKVRRYVSARLAAHLVAAALVSPICAQTTSTLPADIGSWVKFTDNCGIVPVHMALNPGDKLFLNERLHYLGQQSDGFSQADLVARSATGWYNGNPNVKDYLSDAGEFDFNTKTYTIIDRHFAPNDTVGKNMGYAFCGGHSQMADGRYVVVGGDQFWYRQFTNSAGVSASYTSDGRRDIRFYTPSTGTTGPVYAKVAEIYNANNLGPDDPARAMWGRWYPSLVTLPDERIAIVGGQRAFFISNNASWDNPTYEIFNPSTLKSTPPRTLDVLKRNYPVNMYPVVYVLPHSGKLWVYANNESAIVDITANTETPHVNLDLAKENGLLGRSFPFPGTNFVPMLSYRDDYKMESWFCGGVNSTDATGAQIARDYGATDWYANCPNCGVTQRCHYLPLETDGAAWTREDMPIARSQPASVNLPDGRVAILSGSGRGHQGGVFGLPLASQGVKQLVLFDPKAPVGHVKRWVVAAEAPTARHYHNTALLREDGTIVAGGGDAQNGDSPNTQNPADFSLDVYSPPYKFAANILELGTLAVTNVAYGQQIILPFTTANAISIAKVGIIRYASMTHTVNLDQRHIELEILKYGKDKLLVKLPVNSNIAQPGNWMVWPVDSRGVPVKKSARINLRASNPGGDAAWADADTVATPTFPDPYASPVVPAVPAVSAVPTVPVEDQHSGTTSKFAQYGAAAAAGIAAVAIAAGFA
ncbi:uncharacterized protein EV422DRAFT_537492 [Fimicolochytrium jonesii]|uniref:uncharacterized protein n=1 Tax=Fimicolochytrium jonesii TaxID=1396493 RepID=UPI0022FED54D|nr:uncharacterized protein EV422DRAFT_537492 [Fimicolochytrium jonesii]KAI8818561.1 hypothetical protein EV422DRAFT_537492 [Fimicolochytrium jonesii]